jgi:phospholipase C
VFDHTSVIRFLEARFGVKETNISPWRRAVCGDLTSCFDFKTPNAGIASLPQTANTAGRAAALPGKTTPPTPTSLIAPVQDSGARPSRPLPYILDVRLTIVGKAPHLQFRNGGKAGAVFHVYDRLRLADGPRRYTVGAGQPLGADWPGGPYDLWVLGPNGLHRHFVGDSTTPEPRIGIYETPVVPEIAFNLTPNVEGLFTATQNHYANANAGVGNRRPNPWSLQVSPTSHLGVHFDVKASNGWYDISLSCDGAPKWRLRFAGRVETGKPSTTDPAMGGAALLKWDTP